jgi:hypothetical protein
MCRLFAMSSETPESPMVAMQAMDVMREGHDGSRVGLFLRDLGGPFEEIKDAPILSGIFTDKGLKRLDAFMMDIGFMTNGENTAFTPIKEFLLSRDFEGYTGYQSDSEVFTHILHYTATKLGLGIEAYKHIITPLQDDDMALHPDARLLTNLKQSCRRLIIDGPNCVIGALPDHSLFMVQDRKKLRPGVVGGRPGRYAFSSELCGLDAAIPDRDRQQDFQPMHQDTVIVGPERQEVRLCTQTDPLSLLH